MGMEDADGAGHRRSPLEQAANLAREAFVAGDLVVGIAAITLAAQLVQLARIWEDR